MTEYRVVCDADLTGIVDLHYDETAPMWLGDSYRPYRTSTERLDLAEKWLEDAKRECPEFDKRSQKTAIKYRQYNFRIQQRCITEWV